MRGFGLVVSGSRQGPVAGPCEHDNETFCFINGREFLD
jgi:hypothetical protein